MQLETPQALFADTALTERGWQDNVLVAIKDGVITAVTANSKCPRRTPHVPLLLPGMPNLHSHAFQRAMAGLTERTGGKADDNFWSWREVMYDFVQTLTPDSLFITATRLYEEMLAAGYTSVGEFHYLHHDANGQPYADPSEMSQALIGAARQTGIHLTLLPVLYETSDFGGTPASDSQKRFCHTPDTYIELLNVLKDYQSEQITLGIAFHSLRAVRSESMQMVLDALPGLGLADCPIHIHIAEQVKEVEDCKTWSGKRPVQWLLENFAVNQRWCLVHATHMTEAETNALAQTGAIAGLCPTTEANLGDGIFPARNYMQADGKFGIGSDSHISVCPFEELKWLEYSQRLQHKQRAVLCSETTPSVGRTLYEQAARGGAQALGIASGVIAEGARADLIAPDMEHYLLAGKTGDAILDALVFAVKPTIRNVWVQRQQCMNKHA